MTPEQRLRAVELLQTGEDLAPEWQRVLFPPEKRECELVYDGKEREEEILAETMAVPLQPVRAFGRNGEDWSNMLIFGDNLQAMKTLVEMKHSGRLKSADGTPGVRLAYIDPPFATKQEFRGNQEQKAYQDKLAGAAFIEFIRRRCVLIKELLAKDGSLFVHVDHRKVHYLKVILDEVFGESNFRNEIMLPGRASKNLQQQFDTISRLNVRHDTLLWYSASTSTRFSPLWIEKHKAGNPEGHWHHFWSNADRKTMRYPLLGHTITKGQWTWKEDRALKAVANHRRFLKESGGRTLAEYWRDTGCALDFIRENPDEGGPQYWRAPAETRLADTVWSGIPIYSSSTGYPTEKNEALLGQVIELASAEGDLVLDAFVGSGTTVAVAERLRRRWIGIDCGKLSIVTVQKRLARPDPTSKPHPFTLYNAGLYDFSQLRQLPWDDWRFFALQLFQCKDHRHTVGGIELDGFLRGADVLVFNHFKAGGAKVTYDTIDDLHQAVGKKVGRKFFIVAPALSFTFQEDYVDRNGTRYYALRIPYSIINELHRRDFTAIRQPADETEVNNTVEAVGFDFIRTPEAKVVYRVRSGADPVLTLKVSAFKSDVARPQAEGLEALSMLLLDADYDGEVLDHDLLVFAESLKADDYQVSVPGRSIGERLMLVMVDIYGNEFREVKTRDELGLPALSKPNTASPTTTARRKKKASRRGGAR